MTYRILTSPDFEKEIATLFRKYPAVNPFQNLRACGHPGQENAREQRRKKNAGLPPHKLTPGLPSSFHGPSGGALSLQL